MILVLVIVQLEKQADRIQKNLDRSEVIYHRLEEKEKKHAKHHDFDGSDADGV